MKAIYQLGGLIKIIFLLLFTFNFCTGIQPKSKLEEEKEITFKASPFKEKLISSKWLKINKTTSTIDDVGSQHELTLHKCGSGMIRLFELMKYLPEKNSFESKCRLRKIFWDCMSAQGGMADKPHRKLFSNSRLQKKLLQSLWSARGCVLGITTERIP